MEKKKKDVNFKGYLIESLNVQKEKDISRDKQGTFNLKYRCQENKEKKNIFRVSLSLEDLYTNKSRINITLCGFFEFLGEFNDDEKDYFLRISAPAIIYPYIRTIVSNITAFDIDETAILPIINFANVEFKEN